MISDIAMTLQDLNWMWHGWISNIHTKWPLRPWWN